MHSDRRPEGTARDGLLESELLDWLPAYRGRKIHGALAYLDCEDEARRYADRAAEPGRRIDSAHG